MRHIPTAKSRSVMQNRASKLQRGFKRIELIAPLDLEEALASLAQRYDLTRQEAVTRILSAYLANPNTEVLTESHR